MIKSLWVELFTFVFLLLSLVSYSQTDDIHFDCISLDDGLSHNKVMCILQDRQGFMWFGSKSGLNRYDGYSFTVYTHNPADPASLSDDQVYSIYEDFSGELWIGTNNGLNLFMRDTESFQRYYIAQNPYENSIKSIYEDSSGTLWIGTQGAGLYHFDRRTELFSPYNILPEISGNPKSVLVETIYQDRSGLLWVGTSGGLFRIDATKNKIENIRHTAQPSNNHDSPVIYSIYEDGSGIFWIGTSSGLDRLTPIPAAAVSQKNGDEFTNSHFRIQPAISDTLKNIAVKSIFEDASGTLWIGSWGGGIYHFDRRKEVFQYYRPCKCSKESGGLSSSWINTIYQNRSQTMWFGTDRGVGRLTIKKQIFRNYRHDPDDPASICQGEVMAIHEDREGNFLIATWGGGVCNLNPESATFSHKKFNAASSKEGGNNWISSVYEDHLGNIWVGNGQEGGLTQINPRTGNFSTYLHNETDSTTISDNTITTLYEDNSGALWIGSAKGGLNRFIRDRKSFKSYKHDPLNSRSLSNNHVYSIYQDAPGFLWIGTENQLNRFDITSGQFIRYEHHPEHPYTLPANEVYAIRQDKSGNLWFGTGKGLSLMLRDDVPQNRFKTYTREDGLPGSRVFGIVEDDSGILWLLTNKGLCTFNPSAQVFKDYSSCNECVKFTESITLGSNSFFKAKNGEIFLGGVDGITVYQPSGAAHRNVPPPPIVITDFKLNDESIKNAPGSSTRKAFVTANLVQFPSGYDRFSFEFAALDYTLSTENKYAYMLEGHDKDWIYSDTRRIADYSAVAPGEYVFRVKGANHDGIWNEEGIAVAVNIIPPFWKNTLFQLLAGLSVIILIISVHSYRVLSLKRITRKQETFSKQLIESQELERKRIASELHDSIGQNLLIINNEIMQRQYMQETAEKDLQYLSNLVRDSIEEVREISYNLHPHQLERLGLKRALESAVKKAANASKINFDCVIDDIDDLFSENSKIYFFRIIQEAITNIIKHSNASKASLYIERNSDYLITTIADNGKGFNIKNYSAENLPAGGLGLSNIAERVKLLKGKLKIRSNPGEGTIIRVNIPIGEF